MRRVLGPVFKLFILTLEGHGPVSNFGIVTFPKAADF